jgi:hypothetical protein
MKPKDKWFLTIAALFSLSAIIGPKWYLRVQKDRGFYSYGFYQGEIARLTAGPVPAPESDPVLRDERARRFFQEGYADALSHSPPRYPYAPLGINPTSLAPNNPIPDPQHESTSK